MRKIRCKARIPADTHTPCSVITYLIRRLKNCWDVKPCRSSLEWRKMITSYSVIFCNVYSMFLMFPHCSHAAFSVPISVHKIKTNDIKAGTRSHTQYLSTMSVFWCRAVHLSNHSKPHRQTKEWVRIRCIGCNRGPGKTKHSPSSVTAFDIWRIAKDFASAVKFKHDTWGFRTWQDCYNFIPRSFKLPSSSLLLS